MNALVDALSVRDRAALFGVLFDPSQENWRDARDVVLVPGSPRLMTLWEAVLATTDYDVEAGPMTLDWPLIPTSGQLLTALRTVLS